MKKVFSFLLLTCLLSIGVNAWGKKYNVSYTLTFSTGSGDGTSVTTSTSASTILSGGSDYVTGNLAAATNVYKAGASGLKLGKSSGAGSIKISLSDAGKVYAKTIVVRAKQYNGAKNLQANGKSAQSVTSTDFANYSFTINSNITYVQLQSNAYLWIESVTVNYEVELTETETEISTAGLTNTDLFNGASAGTLSASVTSSGSAVEGAVVTWRIDDEAVASINENTGAVTLVAAGTATITASYSGNSVYGPSSDTYELTVADTRTATTTTINTTGIINTNLINGTTAGSLSASVKYGSPAADVPDATITWTSSDVSVATVNSSGVITLIKAGITTIKATYNGATIGSDKYAPSFSSYELTVTDTRQNLEVSLSFNNALYGTNFDGTGAAGDGPFHGTVDNVSVDVEQGDGSNLYVNNTETRIYGKGTNEYGSITISAPLGYVITKIVITKGSSFDLQEVSPDTWTLKDLTWEGQSNSVVFYAKNRSDFRSATVTLAKALTITSAGWASMYLPFKAAIPEDVTVYYASASSLAGNTITLTPFEGGVIPAGTGVVVRDEQYDGTSSHIYAFNESDDDPSDDVSSNLFLGSYTDISVPAGGVYVLASGTASSCTFATFTGSTLGAFKAYVPKGSVSAPNIRFIVEEENGATSINDILDADNIVKFLENGQLYIKRDGVIYDATGRAVR